MFTSSEKKDEQFFDCPAEGDKLAGLSSGTLSMVRTSY
jgi:hypothetical protein